ncbi:MAG: VCBS repeat-containing protein [Polyangiaceae bacterium]
MRRARFASGFLLVALTTVTAGASAQELFALKADPFPNAPCNNSGCWTNYLVLADLDGDNDLDVLMPNAPGLISNGGNQPFAIYANDGQANMTNVSQAAVGDYSGQVRQVGVGDFDRDGDLDIYAPEAFGAPDHLWMNDGAGVFTDEAATRLPSGLGSHAGGVRVGDLDNDGDLDLVVADGYAVNADVAAHIYLNDGTGKFTEAAASAPAGYTGSDPDDVDLVDVDRDFDLDVLINMHSGKSNLWINDGTGTFTNKTEQLDSMPGGYHYGPSACDVDGDGDLDIWSDNMGPNYTEQLQINDGAGTFDDETVARVSGNPKSDDNGVVCADVDHDGDFDAIVASLNYDNVPRLEERVLINDGTGHFVYTEGLFDISDDSTLWMDVADLNGDNKLDAVTGQGEGSSKDFLYLGTAAAKADTVAPRLIKVEAPPADVPAGTYAALRFAVSDAVVSDQFGARLQRAYAKITGGPAAEVEAVFMGGDLYRVTLPCLTAAGSVSVTVCAVDRAGNETCGDTQTYNVSGTGACSDPGTGGGGGAGPSGPGVGGAGVGGNGSGANGSGGSGAGNVDVDDTDDCGCAVPGRSGSTRPRWWRRLPQSCWQRGDGARAADAPASVRRRPSLHPASARNCRRSGRARRFGDPPPAARPSLPHEAKGKVRERVGAGAGDRSQRPGRGPGAVRQAGDWLPGVATGGRRLDELRRPRGHRRRRRPGRAHAQRARLLRQRRPAGVRRLRQRRRGPHDRRLAGGGGRVRGPAAAGGRRRRGPGR